MLVVLADVGIERLAGYRHVSMVRKAGDLPQWVKLRTCLRGLAMPSGLGARDLDAVIDAADRVVASTELDELRRVTVEVLGGLVESPLVAWNEVCGRTGRIEAVTFPAIDPTLHADLGRAFTRHIADHPVINHHRTTADLRPWAISDFIELGAFRRTGLYSEFYRPLGANDQLSFILPAKELIVGIALNTAGPPISDRQRTFCRLLQPILWQTYRHLRARLGDSRAVADLLERRGLTPREVEVIMLVRTSVPSKLIALRLGISPRTVEKHVEHALRKLGVASRLQAVALLNGRGRDQGGGGGVCSEGGRVAADR